jgi:hypothetical protein
MVDSMVFHRAEKRLHPRTLSLTDRLPATSATALPAWKLVWLPSGKGPVKYPGFRTVAGSMQRHVSVLC